MANDLKVVFKSNVQGIAKAGDVKKVSAGFARNFLFPRNLAFHATDSALKQWETVRQGTLSKAQRTREAAETLAQKVEAATCTIPVKASAGRPSVRFRRPQRHRRSLEEAGPDDR